MYDIYATEPTEYMDFSLRFAISLYTQQHSITRIILFAEIRIETTFLILQIFEEKYVLDSETIVGV